MGTVYLFVRKEFLIVLALLMMLVCLLLVCLVGWFVLVLISIVCWCVCVFVYFQHTRNKTIAKSSKSSCQKQCATAANKLANNKQMA
jgi:predicted MFS family arabinose efflux permease